MEMVNFSNETPKFLRVLRFKRRLLIVKIWGVKQAAVVISNSGLCTNTYCLVIIVYKHINDPLEGVPQHQLEQLLNPLRLSKVVPKKVKDLSP